MKFNKALPLLSLCLLLTSCGSVSTETSVSTSVLPSVEPSVSVSDSASESQSPSIAQPLTVTYRDYDGTILQESEVVFGQALPKYEGAEPHRDLDSTNFYIFIGWEESMVDATSIVYTAKYEKRNYKSTDNYSWAFVDEAMTEIELLGFYDPYREYEDVYVPDSILYNGEELPVVKLDSFAIDSQYAKTVHLGKNIREVGCLFISTYASVSVKEITVDPENQYYTSKDGILYSKDMIKLVKVPMALDMETFTLPDTVTELCEMSLQDVRCIRNFVTTENSNLKVIDNQSFSGSLIHDVVLPEGLTTIHIRAFWLAEGILTLNIPGTVRFDDASDSIPFASMPNLNTITFGEGIVSLPDSCLSGCPLLSQVNLPSTLKTISPFAFHNCSRLKEVTLPSGLTSLGESAFMSSGLYILSVAKKESTSQFNLPDGITEIADFAFANSNIQNTVIIPKNVVKIGSLSFYGNDYISGYEVEEGNTAFSAKDGVLYNKEMTSLVKFSPQLYGAFYLPDSVISIDDGAFSGNRTMTRFIAGKGLKTIGKQAFSNSIVTSVSLNEGLTSLGDNSFYYTKCLEEISFPNTLDAIPENCFYYSQIDKITSWGGVKTIGSFAFAQTDKLRTVDLSDSQVETIDDYAFYNLTEGLESFTGSPALATLSDSALAYAPKMTELDLGSCTALTEIIPYALSLVNVEFNNLVYSSSLTKLGHNLLPVLPKLTAVKYTGTKEQWNTLISASLLTTEEKLNNSTWLEWYGNNYSTLTSIIVDYGTSDETSYRVNLRKDKGIIA
ncbi:MAG: leucine-rich repeat domain-containing protein [Bacilli bacterium]